MANFVAEHIPGWPNAYASVRERLDVLNAAGFVHWPSRDPAMPSLKRYLASTKGRVLGDVWTDFGKLEASAKEKVGYPTQKPLALLERIVLASSNEGDVVLDPFCGCATTLVAAEKHGREWVGVDLSDKALELVDYRLREQHGVFGQIIGRQDIPSRTDLGKLPHYTTHKKVLYGEQGGYCNGCGHHYLPQLLEVDHVVPKSRGGPDTRENVAHADEYGTFHEICHEFHVMAHYPRYGRNAQTWQKRYFMAGNGNHGRITGRGVELARKIARLIAPQSRKEHSTWRSSRRTWFGSGSKSTPTPTPWRSARSTT